MKTLLVGAGAVGQVFGYHLHKGGAEVSFFVKEKHATECRRGFTLYDLADKKKTPIRFNSGFNVLTTPHEVAREKWDQVYLCMSSTGLRGAWLKPFLASIGNATLVALQPGIDDRDLILTSGFPENRLVSGMISLVSYHAPLPGERFPEPGMAFWFPPLSPSPFSGPSDLAAEVAKALKAGGQPAKTHPDVPKYVGFPSAALMVLLTGLEAADWKFATLIQRERLDLVCRASQQAFAVVAGKLDVKIPSIKYFIRPFVLRMMAHLAPSVVPFPAETYMKAHFTKVGDQTRLAMSTYITEGKRLGLPTQALEDLEATLKLRPLTASSSAAHHSL